MSTRGERFEIHGRRAPGSYLELTAKSGLGSPDESKSTLAHQAGHHGMGLSRRSMAGRMEKRLIRGVKATCTTQEMTAGQATFVERPVFASAVRKP